MTRESLAKDILATMLPMFWGGPTSEGMTNAECFKYMAHMAVGQADALLEALGTTEPPASWLSKEMQKTGTPAGSLPVLKEGQTPLPIVIGCRVVVCENSDPKLAAWYGRTGTAGHPCRRYKDTLWQVRLSTGDDLVVPESCLERVE